MRISELPEPYKSLANSRRDADFLSQKADRVGDAFIWADTPEKGKFWRAVDAASSAEDLPPIPAQPASDLLTACKWLVGQLQGDSGTGHAHWEQCPEYRAALAAIAKAEGGQS